MTITAPLETNEPAFIGHIEVEVEANGFFSPVDGLERISNCTIEGVLPAEELEKIPTAYDWSQ